MSTTAREQLWTFASAHNNMGRLVGTTTSYTYDKASNRTAMTDPESGVSSYTYDSFGNLAASTGSAINPLRYTAREWDPELNLYFYRYRYYEPSLGRFLSEDPLAFAGGPSFYAYVSNDPLKFRDPFGLQRQELKDEYDRLHQEKLRKLECAQACRTPLPLMPQHPQSADICQNIEDAQRNLIDPNWFKNQVDDYKPWDYKRQGKGLQFEDFGNFNYGATCKAAGFPEFICFGMAGVKHMQRDKTQRGIPFILYPHRDAPHDQDMIRRGMDYADLYLKKRGCACPPKTK